MVLISSCSSDDSSADTPTSPSIDLPIDVKPITVLPKKIIATTVEEGKSGSITYTISYDGNKLKEIALSDASRMVYTYTGDLITKVELFYSGNLQSTDVYAYENGKLSSRIRTKAFNATSQEKLTFVYNANGTVTVNESRLVGKEETKSDEPMIYTFLNGNMVSSEYTINDGKEILSSTFDDKKSPFVNITGVKHLLDLDYNFFDFYSANNTVTNTTVTYDIDGKVIQTAKVTTLNKYNESNLLTEIFVGDAQDSAKFEFIY
jgi:hypothetical protein